MSIPYGQSPNPRRKIVGYAEVAKPSQYERIVSVLREFPEVRNIRAIAEALNEELSR